MCVVTVMANNGYKFSKFYFLRHIQSTTTSTTSNNQGLSNRLLTRHRDCLSKHWKKQKVLQPLNLGVLSSKTHPDHIYLNSKKNTTTQRFGIISTMDLYMMAVLAAQQQAMMGPMAMGGMGHPGMGDPMGDPMMQEAMQRRMERREQRAAMRAALDPMSAMQGGGMGGIGGMAGMGGMGGDPREAMMAAMQGGAAGGAGMPGMPGGGDPNGMMGQGGMGGGMSGMMDPRMTGMGGGMGSRMGSGMGGMMDPRMAGGMEGGLGGSDPYSMMQGQGGMGGGMVGMMDPRMGGGGSGFDMAMGIIMGGGSRGRRCRRC
jgi:hypothetical protein